MVKLPVYHTLNYFHDNEKGCALTVLVNGSRFHIIADASRLSDPSKKGKKISREYRQLLGQVKQADQAEGAGGRTTAPLFVQEDESEDNDNSDEGRDSAVDMSTPAEEDYTREFDMESGDSSTPTTALERWMLSPLKSKFFAETYRGKHYKDENVEDWYHRQTFYYYLAIFSGKLIAEEESSPPASLEKRMQALIPSMPLPKYIKDLQIPSVNAEDVIVLRESEAVAPIHPTQVRYEGKEYFLKVVDPTQHKPMKREIQVMSRIESEGLQHELRVPLLRGLVHFSTNTKSHIMGFLMDPINDPTPLTLMLDSDIPEEKRLKWADESARMVDTLHQHGIIWGDAKGDNLMVDANDNLWIIDFGGSYTEGWVDPKLNETEEGDDMGVRKIANGLRDPEENTLQPGDEEGEAQDGDEQQEEGENEEMEDVDQIDADEAAGQPSNNKRKRADTNSKRRDDGDEPPQPKQRKQSDDAEDSEPRYCYCSGLGSGRMLACDSKTCKRQWFHFSCIGIEEAPATKKWYCDECYDRNDHGCHG